MSLKHFVGKEVMLALLNAKYKDMDLSKKTLNRVLRRERNAVRRASRSKTSAMIQPLPSTCRKIKVSERPSHLRRPVCMTTFMVCFYMLHALPHFCRKFYLTTTIRLRCPTCIGNGAYPDFTLQESSKTPKVSQKKYRGNILRT